MDGLSAPNLAVLLLAALFFLVSWRAARADRPALALATLTVGALCLRGFAAADGHLHEWDERYHALVAKNLIQHPLRPTLYDDPLLPGDDRRWTEAQVWLHKPPLALWLMAASLAVFGVGELAARLPSLVLSTAGLLLTYRLGVLLYDRNVAWLAAFFHATHAFVITLAAGQAASDHVDTVLVFLVELGVLAAAQAAREGRLGWLLAAGGAAGLAFLTKSHPGLLVWPVALAWLWGRPLRPTARNVLLAGVVTLGVALPWSLYVASAFPAEAAWEDQYAWRHFAEPLEGREGTALYHLARMPRIYGELVYVPLAWFLYRTARREREPGLRPLFVWMALPYLVFSLAASKMPAYVMTAAPAVFLVQARFWWWLQEQSPGPRAARVLRGALLILLVLLPLRITLDSLRFFRPMARRPAWRDDLRELPARLGPGRTVLFGARRPIETMFYTPFTAYPFVASAAEVERLQAQGYRVAVYDGPEVPAEVRSRPGVILLP